MPLCLGGFEELARARVGDGAQVADQLLGGHADAGVLDGQRIGFRVRQDADRQRRVRVEHLAVGQQLEVHARQRVRGVRDQLAQEDLALGVQGMDQDVQ